MMVTILLLIKHLLALARRYGLEKNSQSIELIESSEDSCDILSDSSLVFLNCEKVLLNEDIVKSYEILQPKNCCLKWQKALQNKTPRLNAKKKMEYEEDCQKDSINGIMAGFKGNLITPTADCNSNKLTMSKENALLCSTDSIQDFPDFVQDNSDYQWFLDYGCKYNNYSHHQSILSLTRSQDIMFYDDMARNIDANLAEVDMDDFNREDIHSVFSSLPNMQGVEEREMFASVTGSMMVKFDFDSSISRRSNSQEEHLNTSICKSQLLFSPVKENYLPNSNLSVDSLDLSENDINLMVTCHSNKNNYTIAFEGSTVMASDDSDSRETCTSGGSRSEKNKKLQFDVSLTNEDDEHFKSPNHLTTSDLNFTTWSKIKENPCEKMHLRRHPSGNNNTNIDVYDEPNDKDNSSSVFKSLSLPDLFRPKQLQPFNMSTSVRLHRDLEKKSCLKNDCRYVKLYDIQKKSQNMDHSTSSASGKPAHSFNLVKLFIKQKSVSHEGMANYSSEIINTKDKIDNSSAENCQKFEKSTTEVTNKGCLENKSSAKEVNGNEKSKSVRPFCVTPNCEKILSDSKEKKSSRMSYYSDESTQENGSNTESTENITCNCPKNPTFLSSKKYLTEKSIQTSKLMDKNENNQKRPLKLPVYILYPNYSLPNLEFLKKEHYVQNIDFSKVFLKPQKFKNPESPLASPKAHGKARGKRPFSVNDIETLKKTGFKHVMDWESLTFLLPKEYKEFLQEIPEIVAQLKDFKNSKEEMVPLFCLSPPPNRRMVKRPNSCDANMSNENRSFSSTATQPSSGYRGSSTMLNSNHSNNTNFGKMSYKQSTNSDSSSFRRSGSQKSNPDDSNEVFPSRPPLPKSILRINSLDNQQYTCKTEKEYANKRYSMVELTDKNALLEEEKSKKHGLQKQKQVELGSNKNLKNSEPCGNKAKSHLEKDMRRLEELLEISAVFGESIESFTETDMMKLRTQVSKFLTMQKNLEKVSETLQSVDTRKPNETGDNKSSHMYEESGSTSGKTLHTPHNTPEHKKQQNTRNKSMNNLLTEDDPKSCDCNGQIHEYQEEECKFRDENLGGMKKTVSFAEKISFAVKELELNEEKAFASFSPLQKSNQSKVKRPVNLPICEESAEALTDFSGLTHISPDLLHKRDLILDVKKAVTKILKLYKEAQDDPANICLHHLCPSLYAVLSDGLKEEINTPFGPIRNSVWSVIEASSQQGPMTQTLNELVQRLNRDDIFTEGLIKFNAFIFGLLNAKALDGWFSYLRTRDSLLHKYYNNSGLLLLSNTAGAPVRILVDQLITILEPLGSLQFNLDLMHQTKLLHCSLQNLNCLLEESGTNDFLTPTKQIMLLKLVRSIQNSISQSGEGKRSKHVLEDIEQKTSDPPVDHLLENNKNVRTRREGGKTRPRSGCDSAATGQDVHDVASVIKKRWSGVGLNSKLVEAFDRLVDDSESDYTDSLDVAAPYERETTPVKKIPNEATNAATKDSEADLFTKAQKKNILLNLNKKSSSKTDDFKTDSSEKELPFTPGSDTQKQNGGQKFKRLQQKWEKLSGKSDSDKKSQSDKIASHSPPVRSSKVEKASCDTNYTLPSPTSRMSKIPRLVTSPLSAAPTVKPTGNVQRVVSPIYPSDANQKTGKPSFNSPRKEASGGSKGFSNEDKSHNTGLSSKKNLASPGRKNESVLKKTSLTKKPALKKLNHTPRTVRTLSHRLPSDSGHLSFNEGEKLKVILEVDKAWLLCCRGSQKGLVPKSLVISDIENNKF